MQLDLVERIAQVSQNVNGEFLLSQFTLGLNYKNELLFFFKPESFLVGSMERTTMIVRMALKKLSEHEVAISGVLMLSGDRLAQLQIMDRHYGYINKLSRSASRMLQPEELIKLRSSLGIKESNVAVLGGHEFLNAHPDWTAQRLNGLWATKKSVKLRSGFYVQQYEMDGDNIVLVNGFHPDQLSHFTDPTHRVVILLLHSNTDWKVLKNDLVGNTFPERADPNSIRGELFSNPQKYGAESVTISNNFVHLSAGPFEALYEINNFLSGLSNVKFDLQSTNMFRLIVGAGLSEQAARHSLLNPTALKDGANVDLFTCTEDKNSDQAFSDYRADFLS